MYTIRNTTNGQQTTTKTMASVKRVLKNIEAKHGRQALKGIYVDKAGDKDPYYAEDLV